MGSSDLHKLAVRSRKKLPTGGNCYEAAGRYVFDHCLTKPGCDLVLVHGEVAGQGPLSGVNFGHAWVLDGDTVIDCSNGRDLRMPRVAYYAIGGIDRIGNLHLYSWGEARKKMATFHHWGPWDLKTSTGL